MGRVFVIWRDRGRRCWSYSHGRYGYGAIEADGTGVIVMADIVMARSRPMVLERVRMAAVRGAVAERACEGASNVAARIDKYCWK